MFRLTPGALTVAGLTLTAVAMGAASYGAPADEVLLGSHAVGVAEDSPEFNCWTMGNHSCGTARVIHDDDSGEYGAVLPIATDGRAHVAWTDGLVTGATVWDRQTSWRLCVQSATGGDASMFACDADWQMPGDRFHM